MNCTNAQALFNQYLDGELQSTEQPVFEEHLAACVSCSESLSRLRALMEQAEELPSMVSPRNDLWPGIRNQIEQKMVQPAVRSSPFRRLGWHSRPLVTVAATFLIITFSVIALRLYSDGIDSHVALINNPTDVELQSMLSANYRRKVELLQWTAQLTTQL